MAAGFPACCEGEDCRGSPQTCYCDELCHSVGDCCEDINDICPTPGTSLGEDVYVAVLCSMLVFVHQIPVVLTTSPSYHLVLHLVLILKLFQTLMMELQIQLLYQMIFQWELNSFLLFM